MLLMLNRYWLVLAGLLAIMTAGVAVYIIMSKPLHLRVAVGPQGSTDANIMIALDRILEIERASVRLDLVTTPETHQDYDLLERRDVDLAVLRADGPLPAGAGVVAMLRNNVVVIAAPARHKLEHIPDLKGKRLGLIALTPRDEEAVARLLDIFDLKPADVALTFDKTRGSWRPNQERSNSRRIGDRRSSGSQRECNCLFRRHRAKRSPDTSSRGYRRIFKSEYCVCERSYNLQTSLFATKYSRRRGGYSGHSNTPGCQQGSNSANQSQTI
jgi:hypothetical protein